jgi:hypothetical protein
MASLPSFSPSPSIVLHQSSYVAVGGRCSKGFARWIVGSSASGVSTLPTVLAYDSAYGKPKAVILTMWNMVTVERQYNHSLILSYEALGRTGLYSMQSHA